MSVDIEIADEKRKKYLSFLRVIKNLPSAPYIILEVNRMLDSPKTSASDLGKIISRDQGLVARILTVANSPLYGIPRRVSTIEFAIVILGFDHIKNIVIGLSMLESFKTKSSPSWNRKAFWNHSIITAAAAKRISDDLGYSKSGEAFIAGLLHDLGISVYERYFLDEFNNILSLVEEEKISYLEAENLTTGMTHQDIGQFLSEKWNLPSSLGDSILHHHKPSEAPANKELAAIIHFADYLTQKFMIGNIEWDNGITLDESILDILKIGNEVYFDRLVKNYEQLYKHQIEILNQ